MCIVKLPCICGQNLGVGLVGFVWGSVVECIAFSVSSIIRVS